MKRPELYLLVWFLACWSCTGVKRENRGIKTLGTEIVETLHGAAIRDPYRWLEHSGDPAVQKWLDAQERLARAFLDPLPQREWLIERNRAFRMYDDEWPPDDCLAGDRCFQWVKRQDDEKWKICTMAHADAPPRVLIDPNTWNPTETLDFFVESPDGSYAAFGRSIGGDENSVIQIVDVATGTVLPDRVRGWQQDRVSWLLDNSGFYYSAKPLTGTVAEGEEHFWHAVYFHRLGSSPGEDIRIFGHDTVKEYYHQAIVSEDGQRVIFYRFGKNAAEVFIQKVGCPEAPVPVAAGFDADYRVLPLEEKLFIWTDLDAPMGRVLVTDADSPGRGSWREFIPESGNKLQYINGIGGRIFAVYLQDVHTVIKIYSFDGEYLRDLPFPVMGMAGVSGYWSKPRTRVHVSSFTHPPTSYLYDFNENSLEVYHAWPIPIETADIVTEQVFYPSRDGTRIPMFLVYPGDAAPDGGLPVLMNVYGGFGHAMTPHFSVDHLNWIEAGGMVAVPGIRGGGEYGKAWHDAGRLERKQNTIDDVISAAVWLVDRGFTRPDRIALTGTSNGGFVAGAATVQQPDLFAAVCCQVPLLDMLRYHKFGIANLWTVEYGDPDNPEHFKFLRRISPYHNVLPGVRYPAMLFVAGENDARVDPLHARKMAARMQAANPLGNPVLLLVQHDSGHGGGTTLTPRINQQADVYAFLMNRTGLQAPAKK
ncbi:S9 family peptidase [bacterium]|nr:S9 family peptidase [candidate division CSSED10-310 bacterium]